jgi:hypothetical protein
MLRKGGVYQWTSPHTAAGLRFEVVGIHETSDNVKFTRCYLIKYCNYKYKPAPAILEITHSFILRNASAVSIISELDNLKKASLPRLKSVAQSVAQSE